jgi:hypothetical protein
MLVPSTYTRKNNSTNCLKSIKIFAVCSCFTMGKAQGWGTFNRLVPKTQPYWIWKPIIIYVRGIVKKKHWLYGHSLHQVINQKNCIISSYEAIQVGNLKFIALENFPQHLIKYFVLFSSSPKRFCHLENCLWKHHSIHANIHICFFHAIYV